MFRRIFEIFFSLSILIFFSPIIILCIILIYFQDFHNPFYLAKRAGKNFAPFKMIKFRTMVYNAESIGGSSTSSFDKRITCVGKYIRQYKVDEISQFFNVLMGNMALVGPRPNVYEGGVSLYSEEEKLILSVKPGITDLSSIVFSDEGEIIKPYQDPDLAYNVLIRPWKSKLALFYVENKNFLLDIKIIFLTIINFFNRKYALNIIRNIVNKDTDVGLREVVLRNQCLSVFSRKEPLEKHADCQL